MPNANSHTHSQATQISTLPKLTNKYACPTRTARQQSTGYNMVYENMRLLAFVVT